jgi:hypothetical protein
LFDKCYFRALLAVSYKPCSSPKITMSNSTPKLNARLLVIHFIACWFFIYAFQTLAFLYDYKFLFVQSADTRAHDVARFQMDMKVYNEAGFLGLLIAYLISWRISLKRNWFWINSVVVFVLAYFLKQFGWLGWSTLQKVFLAPGHLFKINSIAAFATNGIFMLTIGLVLLFLNSIKRFIDRGFYADKKAGAVREARS